MGHFYELGKKVGRKAREAKWLLRSVAGKEADAIRAEQDVGRDMAAVLLERTARDTDPAISALLTGIAEDLTGAVQNELHRFTVTVVVDESPTAFALPGGQIFVARALIDLLGADRDELAFVVGHEMAHVIRRHAVNRVLQQTALSAAALFAPTRGWLAPLMRKVGWKALASAHSRSDELEADALGVLLARAAGFDPHGGVRALERLATFDRSSALGVYFQTHPPVAERIRELRERLVQ